MKVIEAVEASGEIAMSKLRQGLGDWTRPDFGDNHTVDDVIRLGLQCEHDFVMLYGRWAEGGMPVITADATLQALLACTPSGHLEPGDFDSPYGSVVTWFDPPIFDQRSSGEIQHIRWIMHSFLADQNHVYLMWGIDESPDFGIWSDSPDGTSGLLSQPEARGELLAMRVAVGLSRLIASHRSENRPAVPQIEITERSKTKSGAKTIQVRKLFAVDPRVADACRTALRGGPHAPCLRHLVRGHWRNQACGQARKDRELIWIQPFWRGSLRAVLTPKIVKVV